MSKHETDPRPDSAQPGALDSGDLVEFLSDLAQQVGSTLELDELLARVADGVKPLVDYDTFAVLLLDDLGRELYFHFALGYTDDVVNKWRFGMGQGLVGIAGQNQHAACKTF